MSQPWLTIITVVRDDPAGLERTVASIAAADPNGVEYLVIDGSTNAHEASAICDDVGDVHWIAPSGIYPAMNFGLQRAAGNYVQFLNAGDTLHDPSVLSCIRRTSEKSPAWMFGQVEIVSVNGTRVLTPHWNYKKEKRSLFSSGHFPQHQGTIIRTDLLRGVGGFDESYGVAADYAVFLKVAQISDPLELDFVVATFYEGGLSSTHWRQALDEFHRARCETFSPHGTARLREEFNTWLQLTKTWLYRTVQSNFR